MSLTIAEIKAVSEEAKKKERKLYEDRAAYEQSKKSLLAVKDKIDELDLASEDEHFRQEFKNYIDVIIEANGERPELNPLKTLADKYTADAADNYALAKKILNGEVAEAGDAHESF